MSSSKEDFSVDKSEYHSVFKIFDKENTGEISIKQVFELISAFDETGDFSSVGAAAVASAAAKLPKKVPTTTVKPEEAKSPRKRGEASKKQAGTGEELQP